MLIVAGVVEVRVIKVRLESN